MIRVVLPQHLRTLARVDSEVTLDVDGPVTQRAILDALEARYPMLRGTMRDHVTQQRRALVRFFACEEDVSHDSPDDAAARRDRVGRRAVLHRGRDRRRITDRNVLSRSRYPPLRVEAGCFRQ